MASRPIEPPKPKTVRKRSKGGATVTVVKRLEEDIQAETIKTLTKLGYEVQQTSRRVRLHTCPKCGNKFRPKKSRDGVTPGLSDLVIHHNEWPRGASICIEMKGTETKVSVEQLDLWKRGRIAIARSENSAIYAVASAEVASFAFYGNAYQAWIQLPKKDQVAAMEGVWFGEESSL